MVALAWGVLMAGIVQLAFQLPFLHRLRLLVRPRYRRGHRGVSRIIELIIPAILGGGKSIMIGNLIATLYLEFRNIPFGSAVSVVLLAFVLLGIAFYTRALRASEELRQ